MTLFHRIAVLFLVLSAAPLAAQDKRDIGYAQHLFSRGFYPEARSEFLYQSYVSQDSLIREKCFLWASKSLLENGSFEKAGRELKALSQSRQNSKEIRKTARFEYHRSLYLQKKFYQLDGDCLNSPSEDLKENLLQFWTLVSTGQWQRADSLAQKIDTKLFAPQQEDKDAADRFRSAEELLKKRPDFETVSPAMAAVLSAALPGAGHAYAGNWVNAFGSFFLNAVFISLTAYSFMQKNYAAAGVCGFLEAGWYTGNIVSAYQTAAFKNRSDQQNYAKKINDYFPFGIGYSYPF